MYSFFDSGASAWIVIKLKTLCQDQQCIITLGLFYHLGVLKEIRTEYCFFKDLERIIFMVVGAVEMMRFLYPIITS